MGVLTEQERQTVEHFCKIVKEIEKRKFLNSTTSVRFELNFQNGKLKQKLTDFDEEAFRSFLLDFRKLIMPGHPSNWTVVCNLIEQNKQMNQDDKLKVRKCRKLLKDLNRSGAIAYHVNDDRQKPEKLIDLWLNGRYFHDDLDKQKLVSPSLGQPISKMIFVFTVIDQTKVLIVLKKILEKYI